ncbi:MAG: hypothetical protein EHM23_24145 [Acidobacteria bacterium]|nr:MAG: hypothetical protein EHM23_24145 [Acidobacteriota bacterium]
MKLKTLLTLSILASCVHVAYTQEQYGEETQSAVVPLEVRERLSRLVPDPPPARATAEGQPAFYDSPTLYQYMDGAADVFQIYDVQALFHQDFKAGPLDLTVDIFDMGSLENAFGMYAAERSPKYDFVGVGAQGYRNEGLLVFQDRYYVKLAAFGEGANAALQEFGAAISKRIGDDKRFPIQLSKLPKAHRIPRTEKYLPKDPLGHPFLGPAYQAAYRLESGERILMISVGASAADAASRIKALEDHFRRTGEWNLAPEFGSGAARGSNSFEGSLVATASGRYVVLLLNPSGNSEPFFQDAAAGLR